MKKIVPLLLLLSLTACSSISEKDLMGGTWVATAGYENGVKEGEPFCNLLADGVEFVDESIAYAYLNQQEYRYRVRDREEGFNLTFRAVQPESISHRYSAFDVEMINENEMGLVGDYPPVTHCYMERIENNE